MPYPKTLFTSHQQLLYEQISQLLERLPPFLRADIVCALSEPGKLLAHQTRSSSLVPDGVWALLTFLIAQQASQKVNLLYASHIGIAVECLICALDILDDLEDGDQTRVIQSLGSVRALNVSTALLALAGQAILSARKYGPTDQIVDMLGTIQDAILVATSGQHRDILAEQRTAQEISPEECLEIAAGKAGSLTRLACLLGAKCASAEEKVCEEFSALGEALGIAHQIENDLRDFCTGHKTDHTRMKKTIPFVLAVRRGAVFPIRALSEPPIQESLIATRAMSLLYRERARECLHKIEARGPLQPALGLLLHLA